MTHPGIYPQGLLVQEHSVEEIEYLQYYRA